MKFGINGKRVYHLKECNMKDVWPYLQTLSRDAISRTTFGSCYEEGRKELDLQREQAQRVLKAFESIYIPGWRFVPTKRNKRMKEIERVIQSSFRAMINRRVDVMRWRHTKKTC